MFGLDQTRRPYREEPPHNHEGRPIENPHERAYVSKNTASGGNNGNAAAAETPDSNAAENIAGAHLAALLDIDPTTALSGIMPDGRARVIVDWLRETIYHGHPPTDPTTGKPDTDPWLEDIPVVPTDMVAETLTDAGVELPTRQQVRDFAEADGSADPEDEWLRATHIYDPDLDAAAQAPDEKRINGVPETVFNALPSDQDRQKVRDGKVIAPPQSPTAVARWLVRTHFTRRLFVPPPVNNRRQRRRAWMRTVVRVDQTWYSYAHTAPGVPPRWVPHPDPEWMRGQLREKLSGLWYVKTRQLKSGNEYELKWFNPDDRSLTQVENALADLLNAGPGTAPREIPDTYGEMQHVYRRAVTDGSTGNLVLVRNGVLDINTGHVVRSTPLWFSLSRVEADYDHTLDPYADTAWLRMLRDQWPNDPDAITCLQQWFGYVLSGRTDLQKWMLIIGPSGSGKSIIADVLGTLLGVVNATKLDTLNSQFGLQALYETGTTLALMSDIRFGARDSSTAVGNLLAVTGEDEVTVERKYKTAVSARLPVRFHGSANEMPRWSDNSAALQRRVLILETTRGFRGTDDDDPGLKQRIITHELGHVLRWAVEGLALLNAAGGRFTRSSRADELDAELAELSSPVRTFVTECCELGTADDFVDLKSLYTVWRAWAEANNTGTGMSQNRFRAALKALYLDPVRPGQKRLPDGKPGKWPVVWGIRRAETTATSKGLNGVQVLRDVTTDAPADPLYGRDN